MPVLNDGLPQGIKLPGNVQYAVSLGQLLRKDGRIYFSSEEHLRRVLRVPMESTLSLLGTCQEDLLESAWKNSEKLATWKKIQELGFYFTSSATFAVWEKQPRFDQIYAQERNFATYDIMTRYGTPTIPFIFCAADEDYDAVTRWLDERPHVKAIAVLAQYYRTYSSFCRLFHLLCRFRDMMSRSFHLVIVGCGTAEKIQEIFSEFPNTTIVTDKPVQLGRSGRILSAGLVSSPAEISLSHSDLIVHNILRFKRFCDALRTGFTHVQSVELPPRSSEMATILRTDTLPVVGSPIPA